MFRPEDLKQFQAHGLSERAAAAQLKRFQEGYPPAVLVRPCLISDGIHKFSDQKIRQMAESYRQQRGSIRVVKFVPASGAASRMFKFLFDYRQTGEETEEMKKFLSGRAAFPFQEDLSSLSAADAVNRMLDKWKLADLPKGLVPFHKYPEGVRTAFREHVIEAVEYCTDAASRIHLHFTVSPEHRSAFAAAAEEVTRHLQAEGVIAEIVFSEQSPATDTLAADEKNELFHDEKGNPVFRPGGHGALLVNLAETEADIIFLRNIDNIAHRQHAGEVAIYKEALAGLLLELTAKRNQLLKRLSTGEKTAAGEAKSFLGQVFGLEGFSDNDLTNLLDRPIRVCGMVANTGEPGGGPYFIRDRNGLVSRQIVEKAQVNLADPEQEKIFSAASHFNPVDIACTIRDAEGRNYDLEKFRDDDAGLIVSKSQNGRLLKALELPGLWNGGMAGWLTVFMDVPLATFNPVKTLNDLLRPAHQP